MLRLSAAKRATRLRSTYSQANASSSKTVRPPMTMPAIIGRLWICRSLHRGLKLLRSSTAKAFNASARRRQRFVDEDRPLDQGIEIGLTIGDRSGRLVFLRCLGESVRHRLENGRLDGADWRLRRRWRR